MSQVSWRTYTGSLLICDWSSHAKERALLFRVGFLDRDDAAMMRDVLNGYKATAEKQSGSGLTAPAHGGNNQRACSVPPATSGSRAQGKLSRVRPFP